MLSGGPPVAPGDILCRRRMEANDIHGPSATMLRSRCVESECPRLVLADAFATLEHARRLFQGLDVAVNWRATLA